MTPFAESAKVFGIYDLDNDKWTLDCFDDPRLFSSAESAEEYRTICIDYNSARYEVRRYQKWYVYILKCADDTLYTGITNNLQKRIKQHNEGKGAKYTRGRGPVALVRSFICYSKGEALKLEHKIKKLPRDEKLNYFRQD